jgi:putative heme-binding domain-containing protein
LADRKAKALTVAVEQALADKEPLLRAEARDVLATTDAAKATSLFIAVLGDQASPVFERQRAVAALAKLKAEPAARQLDTLAVALVKGEVPPELRLDVWNALKAAGNATRDRLRKQFEGSLATMPRKHFSVSLHGGDAERGREIFFSHTAAQCIRCHKVGESGGTAGPDLGEVVKRNPSNTRDYLLESMLDPSAKIAPGFGSVSLALADGRQVAGLVVAEDATAVTVQTPDGRKVKVDVEDIERRTAAASPMPSIERTLTPGEVRDLVAFLMTMK